jgi:hypothetical protein
VTGRARARSPAGQKGAGPAIPRGEIRVYRVIDAERDRAKAFDTAERLHAEIWTAAVVAVGRPDRQ